MQISYFFTPDIAISRSGRRLLPRSFLAGVVVAIVSTAPTLQARTFGTSTQLEGLVKIEDVTNTNGATNGTIENTSDQWLKEVHLLVRYHPIHGTGSRFRHEPDMHVDVVSKKPIPPHGSVRFG